MYRIIYEDGTIFQGGEPNQSKWNEIEDKPIKKIVYVLGNHKIEMEDYESYNHIVEHYAILQGKLKMMGNIILMGLNETMVTSIIFNGKEHRIESSKSLSGHEYNNGRTTGWKKGIKDKTGFFKLYEKNC